MRLSESLPFLLAVEECDRAAVAAWLLSLPAGYGRHLSALDRSGWIETDDWGDEADRTTGFYLNMNDTFFDGDSTRVHVPDAQIPEVAWLREVYGEDGLTAWALAGGGLPHGSFLNMRYVAALRDIHGRRPIRRSDDMTPRTAPAGIAARPERKLE